MEFRYAAKNHGLEKIGFNILEKPAETCDVALRAGYNGIEIKGQPDRIPPKLARQLAAAATSAGVSIPVVGGACGAWDAGEERDLGSSDKSVRRQALDYAARCIDLAADLGAPVFEIACAPFKQEYPYSSRPLAEVRAYFIEATSEMCAYAASRGVAIAIEPINRFEGCPGFMNDMEDAMSVVEEMNLDNLGVLVDFFHANVEDVSVAGAIKRVGKSLMNIHLSDSNRDLPGTGHIDFVAAVRELEEIGYQGHMSMGFLPSRPDTNKLRESLLEKAVPFMREQERAAAS